ncbi:MAG: class I tRNA ligase family protein, partial [Nanoarchaeota archaeon]
MGCYQEGFGEFSLMKYSEVNKKVLHDMEQRRFTYKETSIKHRYPHCWRCGEELVFRLVDEWYVKAEEIRQKLIDENKKIKWVPEYGMKRQEEWFKNMSDWLISRKRYWGLPLPIWECSCGCVEVIGDLKELREKAIDKKKVDALHEIHRPWIDEIKIKCGKCGKESERIKDVGDAWLDAGIIPFSTVGPYLDDKKEWSKWFPADLISESIPGQFRGWFNSLFWSSVTLTGKAPFKALLGYETLKDEKGEEMHKSKGNAIPFDIAAEKFGADPMRLLYSLHDPSLELRFGFSALKEPLNNMNILFNINRLVENCPDVKKIELLEDKWILSRLNSLIKKTSESIEELRLFEGMRRLQDFWLKDFSRGYIQLVRERIGENDEAVKYIIKKVYTDLVKMCAPMIPFMTEVIWLDMKSKKIVEEESVHLTEWPKEDNKKIDEKLEQDF